MHREKIWFVVLKVVVLLKRVGYYTAYFQCPQPSQAPPPHRTFPRAHPGAYPGECRSRTCQSCMCTCTYNTYNRLVLYMRGNIFATQSTLTISTTIQYTESLLVEFFLLNLPFNQGLSSSEVALIELTLLWLCTWPHHPQPAREEEERGLIKLP